MVSHSLFQQLENNIASLGNYRPYKEMKQEQNDCTLVTTDGQQAMFSHTLLYVHQKQWQQQLNYNCSRRCHIIESKLYVKGNVTIAHNTARNGRGA